MFQTKSVFFVCGLAIASCLIYKSQTNPFLQTREKSHDFQAQSFHAGQQDPKSEKKDFKSAESQTQKLVNLAKSSQSIKQAPKMDHWQSQIMKTRPYFKNTHEGYALALVAALNTIESEKNDYSESFEQAMNYMQKHPEESYRELMNSMDRLPPDMNSARSYLVQTVVKLDLHEQDKISLLRKDLAYQRTAKANDGSQFSAAISFDALMDVTTDQDLLMNEAHNLAKAYRQSPQVYTALQRYVARYPAQANAIKKSLKIPSK